MERTGHRSIDGIRSYKRTADFQRENIFELQCIKTSGYRVSMPLPMVPKHAGIKSPNATKNVVPGTYNFHSCANVTFNIQYGYMYSKMPAGGILSASGGDSKCQRGRF